MNSNLLKEAIADAKAVRATALANAKAALEEAFNQRFSAVFADKLREDSAAEAAAQATPSVTPVAEGADKDKVGSTKPSKSDGTKTWSGDNKGNFNAGQKNMTSDSIPAAKDGGDGTKGWSKDNKGNFPVGSTKDMTPDGIKENTVEEGDVKKEEVEETVTNEDLDEIIRELEAEAGGGEDPSAGGGAPTDLPAPDASTDVPSTDEPADDIGGEPLKSGDTIVITKAPETDPTADVGGEAPMGDMGGGDVPPSPTGGDTQPPMEEEIDLNELLASLNEEAKADDEKEEKKDDDKNVDESALTTQLNEAITQRDEAYNTVKYLKQQINEINLLNAKLLYTNKLFKEFAMDRTQKVKILEAFDLTKNVREVKMTYANWCESLNFGGKSQRKAAPASGMTTITEGLASKPVASTKPAAEVITEGVSDMAQRFKKLAGIPAKK
jgi:hypothetical protein